MKAYNKRKRQPANECYLSKDFLILYKIYKHKYKKQNKEISTYYEVRINFPQFLNKKQKKRNKKSYGKKLLEKNISFTVKDNSSENVKTAILNKIWEDEYFRKIVKNEVIDALENRRINDVSMLLFSYAFYNEISKNKAFNESVFLSILADMDFSNFMLGEATEFELNFLASCFMRLKNLSGQNSMKEAFTEQEISILRNELPDDLLGNSIMLQLGSGLRSQELLALKKDDISADGSNIVVDKAIKTVDGISKLGPPKSKKSNRIIPIPIDYRKYAIYLRENGAEPFIWTLSRLNPLCSVSTYRKKFKKALQKISDVRVLTPHCCRHTYITCLQAKGVPMETISRLAGHSNIETTDGYLHTSQATLEEAVSRLNCNNKSGEDVA